GWGRAETGLAAKRAERTKLHKRRGRVISRAKNISRRAGALLLVGTVLGGSAAPLFAQSAPAAQPQAPATPAGDQPAPAAPTPAPAPVVHTIRSIAVRGNQRLEPE